MNTTHAARPSRSRAGQALRTLLLGVAFGPVGWLTQPAWAEALPPASPLPALAALPKAGQPRDTASNLGRLLHLVRTEFMQDLPAERLLEGARKGLQTWLSKQHPTVTGLPAGAATSFLEFKKAYDRLLADHPEINGTAASQACMRGLLEVLDDPYSVYLDPEEYKNLVSQLNGGNFGGLGIYIELDTKNAKALTVVEPMEGTPAIKAGIKAHDVLVEIGSTPTRGLTIEEASKLLRGPVGSAVTLTVKRPGVTDLMHFTLTRAVIRVKTLSSQVVDGQIGVVRLKVFGENCYDEMEEAFRAFDKAGVRGYVLDLRNNGGGYITAALDVVSHLLPTGSRVVSVAERGQPELVYDSRPNLREVLPLVVLINKYSASASEITAGAVKDLSAGCLVGERSFGKGSVQKIFPLPDGSAVKITTAHYHTPSGHDIHKKGIVPDVALTMKLEDTGSSNDSQMKAALSYVKQQVQQRSRATLPGPALPRDVVEVASTTEEMRRIDELLNADGQAWEVAGQRVVVEGERYIDEVTLRSTTTQQRRVQRFCVRFIERP